MTGTEVVDTDLFLLAKCEPVLMRYTAETERGKAVINRVVEDEKWEF